MKLEDIGFYTLSNNRVKQTCLHSPMWRTEILLTDKCNFKCPYCRGVKEELRGDMPIEKVKYVIDIWSKTGLKNIRFSGGEPTLYKGLIEVVKYAKIKGVERIAISTNGSASINLYKKLIEAGVNDISVSLDACCSTFGEKMCGGIKGMWKNVVNNIKELSKLTYVTLGMVFTEETANTVKEVIIFGDSLGVADIRIISAAQSNIMLKQLNEIPKQILSRHPILKYRVDNFTKSKNVRGLSSDDYHKCALVIDDSAIAGNYHFPCIIYLREGGKHIGEIGPDMRRERYEWFKNHNVQYDKICIKNCLDVCVAYNNSYWYYNEGAGLKERLCYDNDFCVLSKTGLIETLKNNDTLYNGVFLDFNGIKELNEKLGYDKTNDTLKDVFTSYKFRRSDIVARYFSGDEFIILAKHNIIELLDRFEKHCFSKNMNFKYKILYDIVTVQDIDKSINVR